jgi:hypothetical protein
MSVDIKQYWGFCLTMPNFIDAQLLWLDEVAQFVKRLFFKEKADVAAANTAFEDGLSIDR